MTNSLTSFFSMTPWWIPLLIALLMSVILAIICYVLPYDENGKVIKQTKPRKWTLIDWLISILMFVVMIGLLVLILFIIGDRMSTEIIDCANCTGLDYLT